MHLDFIFYSRQSSQIERAKQANVKTTKTVTLAIHPVAKLKDWWFIQLDCKLLGRKNYVQGFD